jgi:hypothetical protein
VQRDVHPGLHGEQIGHSKKPAVNCGGVFHLKGMCNGVGELLSLTKAFMTRNNVAISRRLAIASAV